MSTTTTVTSSSTNTPQLPVYQPPQVQLQLDRETMSYYYEVGKTSTLWGLVGGIIGFFVGGAITDGPGAPAGARWGYVAAGAITGGGIGGYLKRKKILPAYLRLEQEARALQDFHEYYGSTDKEINDLMVKLNRAAQIIIQQCFNQVNTTPQGANVPEMYDSATYQLMVLPTYNTRCDQTNGKRPHVYDLFTWVDWKNSSQEPTCPDCRAPFSMETLSTKALTYVPGAINAVTTALSKLNTSFSNSPQTFLAGRVGNGLNLKNRDNLRKWFMGESSQLTQLPPSIGNRFINNILGELLEEVGEEEKEYEIKEDYYGESKEAPTESSESSSGQGTGHGENALDPETPTVSIHSSAQEISKHVLRGNLLPVELAYLLKLCQRYYLSQLMFAAQKVNLGVNAHILELRHAGNISPRDALKMQAKASEWYTSLEKVVQPSNLQGDQP